ncbi:MAG: hypothetical protein NTV39_01880 [Candidatus Saccharibacteria bacterium]|nr:hypothetical protein [Candidatus Saccharibacteria bacterium]
MNKKQKNNLKKKIANLLGAFGYFFVSLQWLWVVLLYSSLIIGLAKMMKTDTVTQTAQPTVNIDLTSSVPMIIMTAVITFVMVALTLYILIKIPSTLIKSSKKVVRTAAEGAAPLVLQVQNKKVTTRSRLKLTPFLIIIMKLILIFLPLILAFASQFIEKQIFDFFISIYIGVLLACFSLLFFVFQYMIAEIMLVKRQDIW